MAKVSQGASVGTNPLFNSAGTINDVLDMRERWHRTQLGGGGLGGIGLPMTTDQVKIKNNTGQNLNRGSVVQLGEYLLTGVASDERFAQHMWFDGDLVESPTYRIAILRDPCATSEIVTASCDGIVLARVNVTDVDHTHATPTAGLTYLGSATTGIFELLSQTQVLGLQLMLVRIDRTSTPEAISISLGILATRECTINTSDYLDVTSVEAPHTAGADDIEIGEDGDYLIDVTLDVLFNPQMLADGSSEIPSGYLQVHKNGAATRGDNVDKAQFDARITGGVTSPNEISLFAYMPWTARIAFTHTYVAGDSVQIKLELAGFIPTGSAAFILRRGVILLVKLQS